MTTTFLAPLDFEITAREDFRRTSCPLFGMPNATFAQCLQETGHKSVTDPCSWSHTPHSLPSPSRAGLMDTGGHTSQGWGCHGPGYSFGWQECKLERTGLRQQQMRGAHMTGADKLNKEEEETEVSGFIWG